MEEASALSGIRVLEIGDGFAVAYAGKLLAELGADVVKLEPAAGDAARRAGPYLDNRYDHDAGGLFVYLNTNKRLVTADTAASGTIEQLLPAVDAVIYALPAGHPARAVLEPSRFSAAYPRSVACDVSVFGASSRYAQFQAPDLITQAASGYAYVNGADPMRNDQPPLKQYGSQAEYQAGCYAAITVLAALLAGAAAAAGRAPDGRAPDGRAPDGRAIEVRGQPAMCVAAALHLVVNSYTGDAVDAQTALRMGWTTEVVPAAELEPHVEALARRIANAPTEVLYCHKKFANKTMELAGMGNTPDFAAHMFVATEALQAPERADYFAKLKESGVRGALDWQASRYADRGGVQGRESDEAN